MQVKTSELTSAALDWVVAKCEGLSDFSTMQSSRYYYSPSTKWAQGGPIIERETIRVGLIDDSAPVIWSAQLSDPFRIKSSVHSCIGPTALVAAMRCYAASKLGNTVEIPDELIRA